jgi:hypothetical protein
VGFLVRASKLADATCLGGIRGHCSEVTAGPRQTVALAIKRG